MTQPTNTKRDPVRRAIEVLMWLSEHPGKNWGPRQIARDIATSPPTVHRILQTFESSGLVCRGPAGTYAPNLMLYRLGKGLTVGRSYVSVARPHLEELFRQCDETVLLCQYDPSLRCLRFVDSIESRFPLRYVVDMDVPMPLYAGATGLAILAFLEPEERACIYHDGVLALTSDTLTSEASIEKVLDEVRARGVACTHGQRIRGAAGVAAPVFGWDGRIMGDVCVTVPEVRFNEVDEKRLMQLVEEAGSHISADLQQSGVSGTTFGVGRSQEGEQTPGGLRA